MQYNTKAEQLVQIAQEFARKPVTDYEPMADGNDPQEFNCPFCFVTNSKNVRIKPINADGDSDDWYRCPACHSEFPLTPP